MSQKTMPTVGGTVMRLTREDSCGRPAYGDRAQLVTDGFVSIAPTANYEDGNEKSITNARGARCVYVPANAELTNVGLDVVLCGVDPEAYTLMTGYPVIYDPKTGDAIGYKVNRGVRPNDTRLALEAWTDAQGAAGCEPGEDVPYGYFAWPYLTGGRVGDYTIEDNAVTFSVTGMTTNDGSLWGRGPYNVLPDSAGNPGPLYEDFDALDHQIVVRTTVAPPEATYGLVPLDDPDGPNATGATAGAPGFFTPAGAVRPFDLPALQAANLTASPVSWSTGQYVVLGDGSRAHHDGTGWSAGSAF